MTEPQQEKADWLSWCMQFAFGCFVGVLMGLVATGKGKHHPPYYGRNGSGSWLANDDVFPFVVGMGLLMGAIGSNAGNSVWAQKTFTPEKIKQTRTSKLCSLVTGIIGIGLMVFAVTRTMGCMGR